MKILELVIAFDMWGDTAFLEETRLVHVYKSSISTQSSVTTAKVMMCHILERVP